MRRIVKEVSKVIHNLYRKSKMSKIGLINKWTLFGLDLVASDDTQISISLNRFKSTRLREIKK